MDAGGFGVAHVVLHVLGGGGECGARGRVFAVRTAFCRRSETPSSKEIAVLDVLARWDVRRDVRWREPEGRLPVAGTARPAAGSGCSATGVARDAACVSQVTCCLWNGSSCPKVEPVRLKVGCHRVDRAQLNHNPECIRLNLKSPEQPAFTSDID